MRKGPDFICIGSQRAGTTTMHKVLKRHPDTWMPPIKELHVFDTADSEKRIVKAMDRLDKQGGWRAASFMRRYRKLVDLPAPERKVGRYARLFEPAGSKPTGDITPAYATLDDDAAGRLADGLPGVKILYVLREPVARLWSQARMWTNVTGVDWISTEDAFRRFCAAGGVRERSLQSAVIARWRPRFGERFVLLWFDDLKQDAQAYFDGVCDALGIARFDRAGEIAAGGEKDGARQPMPESYREIAADLLAGEHERLAGLAGGHAERWLDEQGIKV